MSLRSAPPATPRTAVVTGVAARRGIGRATAHRFAADGWAVAGLDLDGEAAADLAAELSGRYAVPAFGCAVDVADERSVHAARDAVFRAGLPPVGAVLNVAGITSPVPFLETSLQLWQQIMGVNATGTFLVTRAFVPAMVEQGRGRVINVASVAAQQGGGIFGTTAYSASKAAILGFTRAAARELATHQITVNAVAPGAVDTDIREPATTPEREAAIVAATPLGRQASVDDVSSLIAFLASEQAGFITGCTYSVNGGSYIS
jgi:2-hydroxycyclohexanecarboxyl-CoA dehydrogenase